MDPSELSEIAQLFLARGLWGIQRRNRTNARDDSLHRATAGTSSDPNIPRGISDDITEARDDIRREIPLGLATRSNRPYGTDRYKNAFQAINCLATIIQSLRDGPSDRSLLHHGTPFLVLNRSARSSHDGGMNQPPPEKERYYVNDQYETAESCV